MRWLVLTDDFPPLDGGVATWTAAMASGLHAAGCEVTVLARRRPGLGIGLDGEPSPFVVRPVSGPRFGRLGGWWTAAAAWRAVREVDAVLASTWPVATGLAARCARLGIPLHVAWHGSDATRPPVSARGRGRVLRNAAWHWTASGFLSDLLAPLGVTAQVLPAPIDVGPPIARPPSMGPLRWGLLGRATPLKGGDRTIRLAAAAGAHLTVIGDGPALPAWQALARDLGAADRVDFLGRLPRQEIPAHLATWDLALLLPRALPDGSGAEGFGLSLVEAAAAGVATIGCATGGVPEALGAGLLLAEPDDVAGSLRALQAWWHPDRGEACRRWVAEHAGRARAVERLLASRGAAMRDPWPDPPSHGGIPAG